MSAVVRLARRALRNLTPRSVRTRGVARDVIDDTEELLQHNERQRRIAAVNNTANAWAAPRPHGVSEAEHRAAAVGNETAWLVPISLFAWLVFSAVIFAARRPKLEHDAHAAAELQHLLEEAKRKREIAEAEAQETVRLLEEIKKNG